ncbi:hypothetical protein E2320_017436 [Naja naja]|nr:hypothetical protein E2320_017436 [Naja naja]
MVQSDKSIFTISFFLIEVGRRELLQVGIFLFCLTPIHKNILTFNSHNYGTYKVKKTQNIQNLLEYLILSIQKHFEILLQITMYIIHYIYVLSLDYLEHQVNQIYSIHEHTKICMSDSHTHHVIVHE